MYSAQVPEAILHCDIILSLILTCIVIYLLSLYNPSSLFANYPKIACIINENTTIILGQLLLYATTKQVVLIVSLKNQTLYYVPIN